MLFTTYEFLLFIAVLFLAYYLLPKKCQWPLLLAASYFFYFIAGAEYLIYIAVTTVTVYFAAVWMDRNVSRQSAYLKAHKEELSKEEKKVYKDQQKKIRLRWFLSCLLLNLGILAVVKYSNFMISNVNGVLGLFRGTKPLSFVTLAVPMGISFYTFQAIGYLMDVYRGTVPAEKNIFKFALFVSFFPQLVQGPISRFGDLAQSLYGGHRFDARAVSRGLQRMLWGYFKKMVVADRVLAGVTTLIGDLDKYNGAYIVAVIFFYTLELYADFTGGIDITIGIAETLGISMQENFNRPFFSKSLKEYWRRWHITMGTWFRDYIFYPFSISKPMQKITKAVGTRFGEGMRRRLPVYLATILTWFATGVWHGASWNYIVWGLGNCAVLLISEEFEPLYAKFHARFDVEGKFWYRLFTVVRTFLLVCCFKIFDCYATLGETFRALGSMFTARNWEVLWDGSMLTLRLTALDYGILAVGVLVMLGVSLLQRGGSVRERIAGYAYPVRFAIWYGLFLVVLLAGAYGIGYDASQFIYNRF